MLGVVLFFALASWAGPALAAEALARYDFGGIKGILVPDRSGHGYDGLLFGPRVVGFGEGQALAFAGGGEHVRLPDALRDRLQGDLTFAAWVRLDAEPFPNPRTNWTLIDQEILDQGGLTFRVDGERRTLLYRASRVGANDHGFGAVALANGVVHHVAFVRAGTTVRHYVDGRPDVSFLAQRPAPTAVALCLGGPTQSLAGTLIEAAFYGEALDDTEVAALAAAGDAYRGAAPVALVEGPPPLLASWAFTEGAGATLADESGNGNAGTVHGAAWIREGPLAALRFDGLDDHVDCGAGASLDQTGPITLEAWVRPLARPGTEVGVAGKFFDRYLLTLYKDGNFWGYVGSGGNSVKAPAKEREWQHVVLTFDGAHLRLYRDGRTTSQQTSQFHNYPHGQRFRIGCAIPGDTVDDPAYANVRFFHGDVGAVRVYGGALSPAMVARRYRETAGRFGHDTAHFGTLRLIPYLYPAENTAVIALDYSGLFPVDRTTRFEATLRRADGDGVGATREAEGRAEGHTVALSFDLGTSGNGAYRVDAVCRRQDQEPVQARLDFAWPPVAAPLPAPTAETVGPLPPLYRPPAFEVAVLPGGAVQIRADGRHYTVTSSFSWPNGGLNRLGAAPDASGEPDWRVRVQRTAASTDQVIATGLHYRLERTVRSDPPRIVVQDRISNLGETDLGLVFSHELSGQTGPVTDRRVGGFTLLGRRDEEASPLVYLGGLEGAIGMLPLDDVFVFQAVLESDEAAIRMGSESFAMPPGGAYTFEWAVYPAGTGSYWDFLNTVRLKEDRIGSIPYAVAPLTTTNMAPGRREVPSEDYVRFRGMTVGMIPCLSVAADDAEVSIEGIEFVDFPEEMRQIRAQVDAVKAQYPGMKVIVHVAHSLYATNRPERYADSRVLNADGTQAVWPAGHHYISQARQEDNWRWWIFYPTPGNTFHQAMLDSIDVMMGPMGLDGGFMDGFLYAYISTYTYDRWDGYTADIDPATKTITRKKGHVRILSQPSMIEYSRKIRDKGGIVVANNAVYSRTLAAEKYIIHDREITSGPFLHLAPNLSAMGDPARLHAEEDIYEDILDKLSWGMTYIFYGGVPLTHPHMASFQYPITFSRIYQGTIIGDTKIVTMNPGIYGWPGGSALHRVRRFDSRGAPAPHEYLTTVDAAGVRTRLDLAPRNSAILDAIPARITAGSPLNTRVEAYQTDLFLLRIEGTGAATLTIADGDFPVRPGAHYTVTSAQGKTQIAADAAGVLAVPLSLDAELRLRIVPAGQDRF
jgi:hypothetical protein